MITMCVCTVHVFPFSSLDTNVHTFGPLFPGDAGNSSMCYIQKPVDFVSGGLVSAIRSLFVFVINVFERQF
jgi:hypothetical protein